MSDSFCRNCGAAIEWAVTEDRKRMPLDVARYADDDETANVAVRTDHTGRLWARVLRKDRPLAGFEHRRMPHFATCTARRPAPPKPVDELAARRRARTQKGRHR